MRPNSKRYWRAALRKVRRRRARDLRWVRAAEKRHQMIDLVQWSEKHMLLYNRAVDRLNRGLRKPDGGYSIIDGAVPCPVCGREWWTFGHPDEWTRNERPAREGRSWDVSGYWPGTAQCCGLLIAPDFEQQCIVMDEEEYRKAMSRKDAKAPREAK